MLKDDPNLKSHYRMPRVFGALPGPRNVPKDKQNLPNNESILHLTVSALTDAKRLAELCPPDCELDGDPVLTVGFSYKQNIGWLGGHDYSIARVAFRIAHESKSQGRVAGSFQPVLWENLADPIITGREELGYAKIYGEIPPVRAVGDSYQAQLAWQGFRILNMELDDMVELTEAPAAAAGGAFHYKFIPSTGAQGEADVAYLEYSPPGRPPAGYSAEKVVRRLSGKGTFKFNHARWEDVPFQYPIINALADLPILEVRSATAVYQQGTGAIGDVSADGLRPLLD
jgi:hypothetical protein